MKFNRQDISIGLLSGAATAILCLGVTSGSGLSILLYLLSAVPIMAAGLGWGVGASIVGSIVASVSVLLIANVQTAIFIIFTTALPAAFTAYWLTLSRPAEEVGGKPGELAWFPLSDVLMRLCLMVGASFIIIGVMVGYGPELMEPVLDELVIQLQQNNPDFAFSAEGRAQFEQAMIGLIPFFQPTMWVLILTGNLYIAMRITQASGLLKRPVEFFPITMRMPKPALIPLAVGAGASFIGGGLGLAGSALCGALTAGFMLSGFAIFHAYTMGKPWRPFGLILLYVMTVITMLPPLIMFFVGLFSLARTMPTSTPPKNPNE